VTSQIERDDAVVACERLHMVGKIFLGTAETVYQQRVGASVLDPVTDIARATPSSVVANAVVIA
jgi:hypothetical protein